MNHFFKAFLAIFIGLSSILAQEPEKPKNDSIYIGFVKDTPVQITDIEDTKINNWQLSENIIYESYPDSIAGRREFVKGKEFLNLSKTGEYVSVLNSSYNSGV